MGEKAMRHVERGKMGMYKVGDKVRVREWNDMAKEFGSDKRKIFCRCSFVDYMKPLCGKVFTVIRDNGTCPYCLDGEASGWMFSDDMLYPAITYREYMKENFPDDVSESYLGGVNGCPDCVGLSGLGKRLGIRCADSIIKSRCYRCWDQYMTEAEYKKYVLKEEDKEEMDYKVGDIVKDEDSCQIEGFGAWYFPHKDLEPATPKDILAPFCVVKTRSGNVGLFVGNNRVLFNSTFMDIDTHSNTLKSRYADDCDIVEIYAPATDVYDIHQLISKRGERIWKREEVVEITAEEAAKKLSEQYPGQRVKIIV